MDSSALIRVVSILEAKDASLKRLLAISDRDAFTFFRGADLTGLDLSGQDLTGLNFDYADLRFSKIDRSSYDAGAFNLSKLDSQQMWLKDQFEFTVEELVRFPIDEILVFAKIRPEFVDLALQVLRVSFSKFSSIAGVSVNSLRKSRNGGVVAIETAQSILTNIESQLRICKVNSEYLYHRVFRQLRQPLVQFLSGGNNGPFIHISREKLSQLIDLRRLKVEQYTASGHEAFAALRDTPEYLELFASGRRRFDEDHSHIAKAGDL